MIELRMAGTLRRSMDLIGNDLRVPARTVFSLLAIIRHRSMCRSGAGAIVPLRSWQVTAPRWGAT